MIRKLCLAGLFVLAGVLLLSSQTPTPAKDKKEDLKKQVADLKKTLAERDQHIKNLEAQIVKLKIADAKDDAKIVFLQQRIKQLENDLKNKKGGPDKNAAKLRRDLDAANQTIRDRDDTIAYLKDTSPKKTSELTSELIKLRKAARDFETLKKAPFAHTKILKLKKIDDEQVKAIYDEANKTLGKIDGVLGVWIGKRAENGTPELAQKGYQLGLVVLLDDAESLQRFLDDPLHKQFTDRMGSLWERPLVYDIQRDAPAPKKE